MQIKPKGVFFHNFLVSEISVVSNPNNVIIVEKGKHYVKILLNFHILSLKMDRSNNLMSCRQPITHNWRKILRPKLISPVNIIMYIII